MLKKFGEFGSRYGMLPIRLALGIIFFAHGGQKVFGWFGGQGLEATVDAFQKHMGIPAVLAYATAFTELLGGLLVILGFFTRLASLGIAVIMTVAIFQVHLKNGFFMNWFNEPNKGHGIEYNIALLGMALTLFLFGAGKPAIDSFC